MSSPKIRTKAELAKIVTAFDIKPNSTAIGSWKMKKLNLQQQHSLIDYLAQGLTTYQAIEKMKDDYGVDISYQLIASYLRVKKWRPMLRELKAKYRANFALLDATHKGVRIKRMDQVMDMAIRRGQLNVAVKANEQIRREFEKDGGDINIYNSSATYQQMNVLSTEELIKRFDEATKKLKEKSDGPSGNPVQEISEYKEQSEDKIG